MNTSDSGVGTHESGAIVSESNQSRSFSPGDWCVITATRPLSSQEMSAANGVAPRKTVVVQDSEVRAHYLSVATLWHALAQELEAGNLDPEMLPTARQSNTDEQPDRN